MQFGSIFRYREQEYVFIVYEGDVVYAALILSPQRTQLVKQVYESQNRKGGVIAQRLKVNPSFCFVELSTEDFLNRIAYLARPGLAEYDVDNLSLDYIHKQLNEEDLECLKNEMKTGPVVRALKEFAEKLG